MTISAGMGKLAPRTPEPSELGHAIRHFSGEKERVREVIGYVGNKFASQFWIRDLEEVSVLLNGKIQRIRRIKEQNGVCSVAVNSKLTTKL